MRTLAHISDIHFGAIDLDIARGLLQSLQQLQPDMVLVSGDLTQRARSRQFQAARRYLDNIPFPKIVVPGNHDIPLYNIYRRFQKPLEKYQRYITSDMSPFFEDQELAVLGVNTARSLTFKNGRVSVKQMHVIARKMCTVPDEKFKILVTHHPFLPPPDFPKEPIVGRARRTLKTIEHCRLDLLLSGHFHQSYAGGTHAVHTMLRHSVLVIQAGTATSTRLHHREKNAYNVIHLRPNIVDLTVQRWNGRHFEAEHPERYLYKDHRWHKAY
ncbi:MAG: metallophosphoesterase [Candidatus Vecturithrix sp.]|jgi:3',5'-cyclic AMP phosphodiesterase CpdA|nr:metallophosphoesterase [Candidatus Vecturithrix sp.]